ncbi:MAG: spore coat protein U domain-containing protein [Methyloglobulus sp.]|nr:spore coat protein U domain-containing protein [Methyloglobulus sp.]
MKTKPFNNRVLRLALASVLAVVGGTYTVNSYSLTQTTTFVVSATVSASCTISAAPLAFGAVGLAVLDQTSILTATCTNGTPYVIGMSAGAGTGPTATPTARHMNRTTAPLTDILNYTLFSDAARTINWGAGVTVVAGEVAGTGTGLAQTITVYGRVPPQSSPVASYSDTVTAQINF